MSVLQIRLFGDPVLRTPADEVVDFDRQLRRLVKDLTETLADEQGSGLAAPQVGVGLRVFVFQVKGVRGHLVNPKLDFVDDEEQTGEEGCLSAPGLYYDTRRRMNVVARGLDQHGRETQVVGTAGLARCLQHENDHLDGVLFIDRLDRATRQRALREIEETFGGRSTAPPVKVSPHPLLGRPR